MSLLFGFIDLKLKGVANFWICQLSQKLYNRWVETFIINIDQQEQIY